MADNSLLQKGFSEGFDDLFDEDEFKEKQKYANFIFWIALLVEIVAASIGAFFAWSTGFNAYEQIPVEERTGSAKIYAIQGALPFLLIAIIEPLKIPLAGGLYMVSDLRWKFIIFLLVFSWCLGSSALRMLKLELPTNRPSRHRPTIRWQLRLRRR